jgi:hypothetical protein
MSKPENAVSILEAIAFSDAAFLIYSESVDGGNWMTGEILPADCYLNCEEMEGYINDMNIHFDTASQAQTYYRRFGVVWAFDGEDERDDALAILENPAPPGAVAAAEE